MGEGVLSKKKKKRNETKGRKNLELHFFLPLRDPLPLVLFQFPPSLFAKRHDEDLLPVPARVGSRLVFAGRVRVPSSGRGRREASSWKQHRRLEEEQQQ